jgi:pyridoxal phosphate enzyme (YggS family)
MITSVWASREALDAARNIRMELKENIARVQDRIAAACRRSGRQPHDVMLVAISKTVPPERIRRAFELGLRDFGENRVQEAEAKRAAVSDLTVTWHFVGHLQTNKDKAARELFHWVHSADSLRVALKLDQAAVSSDHKLPVLLQVNLGEEPTKAGAHEEEVMSLVEQIGRLQTLELRGLMTLPPFLDNPEHSRPFFRRLRELAGAIESRRLPGVRMRDLSMGMSHDFEVAIEEGATMVRIGSAIFGPRTWRAGNREQAKE